MSLQVTGLSQQDEGMVGPGDVLAGKYRIERVLGRGGMGVVVAAVHIRLDERVAIKFLRPGALENADATGRFDREARLAAKIKSEYVARVTDVGTLDSGAPYMVMEHLEGSDLGQLLRVRKRLPIDEALTYVLQVCEVLAEAHALGIVHRDLKPGNLFLTRRADGTQLIKVLDFGISKIMDGASSEAASLTATDTVLGSPIYMSPEQMTAPKTVDTRADIWSLGGTLFMLITGRPPFDGESMAQVCGMILLGKPPSLLELLPDAPPALAETIARCLQRPREERFQTIAELAHALAAVAPPEARISADRAQRVLETTNPGSTTGPGPRISGSALPRIEASQPLSIRSSSAVNAVTDQGTPKTNAGWTQSGASTLGAPPAPVSRARWALIGGAVLAVLGVGMVLGTLNGRREGPNESGAASSPLASTPAAASIAAPAPTSSVEVAPAASLAAAPSASAPAKPAADGKAPTGKPGIARTTTPAAKPPGPKKGSGDLFDDR
ncbi:MAG: serine/threonine-protein kinase [Minicystis sp.]